MPGQEETTLIKQPLEPVEVKQNKTKQNKNDVSQDLQQSILRSHSQDSLKNKVDLASSIVNDQDHLQQQKKQEIEQIKLIPEDFYYENNHQQKVFDDSPIPEYVVEMDGFFGFDSFKRYNPKILDKDHIIYSSGISYTILNHSNLNKEQRRFYSIERGGIGCIAVSQNKKYFAIGEMGFWPNVYIYEYPSLRLYRILRKGTQRTYSSICFSNDGNLLVTVGGDPDFLIAVWQWKQQRLMLKSKAFSQDIYRVSFSQFNQNLLTTSGTGHIRFWKIAETFTGLKLQGDIAKFGQFQLSDVVSYAEFEDGNVLSSSEYGKLLLWQGNLIKSVISIDCDTPCHKGSIQYVRLIGKQIITSGSDGYIRFWNYNQINDGQSDQHFNLFVKPKKQIYFQNNYGKPAYINWIQIENQFWLVQDAHGVLYKFIINQNKKEIIFKFNSGRFTDVALSPLTNCCITTGYDGEVRLFDYGNKRMFYSRRFGTTSQSTCIEWLPFSKKNGGRMIVVGFADGIVRFLGLQKLSFTLIKAQRVHKYPIIKIKSNRQGSIIAVCDTQGSIFLLDIHPSKLDNIIPYCLFQTGFKINDMCFDKIGQKLLLACNDGKLHQIFIPKISECNFDQSYLHIPKYRSFTIKMMESQKPKRQDLELQLLLKKTKGGVVDDAIVDEQWEPAPILNATYYDSECSKILCSVDGKFLGNYYIVDMMKQRPIGALESTKQTKTSYLSYNQNTEIILIGYRNGSWQLRHKYNPNMYLKKQSFDHNYGITRKVGINLQNTAVIVVGEDGTMISYKIDYSSFIKGSKGDSVEKVQVTMPAMILGLSQITFADEIEFKSSKQQSDIIDGTKYCLQQQKLKREQSEKMSEAQKTKQKKKKKIQILQKLYKQVIESNNAEIQPLAKLKPQQLIIDQQYQQMLKNKVQQQIDQTKKVMMWDVFKSELFKKKLQKYFFDQLSFDNFNVKGIKINTIVSSFKLQKLSSYVLKQLEEIQRIINQQKLAQNYRNSKNDRTMSQFDQSKTIIFQITKLKDPKKTGKQQNFQVRNKIREAQQQFQKQLQYAQSTMGDYKLKSSNDYIVPQNERLNVSRKKKHLFLHYQYLFLQKEEFNKRLNKLRNKKKIMITNLQIINHKIRDINQQLEIQEKDIFLDIDQDLELLQTEFDINEDDIAEHLAQKQKDKDAAKKGSGMGMGNANEAKQDKNQSFTKKPRKKKINQKRQDKSPQNQIVVPLRKNMKVRRTPLEDEFKQIKRIELQSEKQRILNKLNQQIEEFDKQLNQLRIYKYQLQNDLTLVQMKLLTYTQQFLIFRDMETYDNQLMTSIKNYSTEKQNLQNNFIILTNEINEIQIISQELKKKFQDEKKILKEFVYPDDEEMRERIIRYYKIRQRKRIQKLKKQQEMEAKQKSSDDEENDQDNDSQDQQDEQDELDDEDEQKPDINIIQNDHKNFERVRKICQYDQKIEQNQKRKSELQKQRNQISSKIKTIDNQLVKSDKQLKIYQKKKLLKINQLFISLPIKTSQIQYVININGKYKIHQDFSNAILFQKEVFFKLGDRIQQLKKQKVDIQKKQRVLNKKLSKLTDQVAKASNQIQIKRKQYQQKQILKFGSTFELEKLKELQPNDQVLDMRGLYKKQEKQVSNRIEQIKQELQQRKRQLFEAKRQNTRVITEITDLGNKETELKKKLDSTNKQLFKNYDVSKKDQLEKERQNLKDLIKFLSKQIEDLKTQIGLFKRKGGHIYTMVTSNKKNFA